MIEARVRSDSGELAARGAAVETVDVFIYDRIATKMAHRRRGLGQAVMSALGAARRAAVPELLVATEEGRSLYATLGWQVVSPFATAAIPA